MERVKVSGYSAPVESLPGDTPEGAEGGAMVRPRDLKLDEQPGYLTITWMDGTATRHSMTQLRKDCPCATCNKEREKLSAPSRMLRVISSDTPTVSQARVLEFSPVGRYALSFVFNDGHSTGIYTYDFLRSSGQQVGPS